MSTTQRQAVANYRRRLRRKGLARLEIQAPESDAQLLRKLALTLRGDPVRAAKVRQEIGRLVDEARPGLKEILASAPLEGIDLSRPTDLGRDVDL